jgi:Predicted Peptidoglycan domain
MRKRKPVARAPKEAEAKPAARSRPQARKRAAPTSTRKRGRAAPAAEPEVRRAIPLDYVTTEEVDLRVAPDFAAQKLSGGLLGKGTVVRVAPQDWWYVEVAKPTIASGLLRGWLSNAALRRATEAEEGATAPLPETPPTPIPSDAVSHAELRTRIATSILNFEARRDSKGHLAVYDLPAGDGGGRYEVAGINERYHPQQAAKLRDLINAGQYDEAERLAAEYIAEYTDVVAKWTTVPPIEAYLRDSAFNRGPGGAAKILQMALGVKVDGGVGPETLAALRKAEKDPARLLAVLRVAREHYELRVAGRREKFWKGLVNRWDNSLTFAQGVA